MIPSSEKTLLKVFYTMITELPFTRPQQSRNARTVLSLVPLPINWCDRNAKELPQLITHVTQLRAAEKTRIVTSVIPERHAAKLSNTIEPSIDNGSC